MIVPSHTPLPRRPSQVQLLEAGFRDEPKPLFRDAPGSFVTEALALGLDVTGCHPMYAHDAAAIRNEVIEIDPMKD